MEARELRIGNYLQDTNHPERFCRVFRLSSGNDYSITYSYNKAYEESYKKAEQEMFIQPIPLTEDWLVKLGFEKCQNGVELKCENGTKINSLFTGYPLTLDVFGNRAPLYNIKYVHQLQNLFYSLTGEELKIF